MPVTAQPSQASKANVAWGLPVRLTMPPPGQAGDGFGDSIPVCMLASLVAMGRESKCQKHRTRPPGLLARLSAFEPWANGPSSFDAANGVGASPEAGSRTDGESRRPVREAS